MVERGVARMTLPPAFVTEVLRLCGAFLTTKRLSIAQADSLVGKAGRVADVLPLTRPFVATLYAAMAAALAAAAAGAREAPPGMVACRRFRNGARWLQRILGYQDQRAPVPHANDVRAQLTPTATKPARRIEVDASPWGGGAVLYVGDRPVQCFSCRWRKRDFRDKAVEIGQPASQTYFEVLALVLATELWCTDSTPTEILGDNVAALQTALTLKGRGEQLRIIQALAVIRSARCLDIRVAHLPSESNTAADTLSRQHGPPDDRKQWPFKPADGVETVTPVEPTALWALLF